MITMISAFISLLLFRFRSRAGLELELVALRHQVAVLRRQRKGRVQLFFTDRSLWVWPLTARISYRFDFLTLRQYYESHF